MAAKSWALHGASLAALCALAACGGGGGGGVSSTPAPPVTPAPSPTPTPAPAPTPTPTPTPTASNDTAEYRATVGAVSMNALAAYNAGATGTGVGIAIIDSGIDLQSEEFPLRVSAASQPLAGNITVDDEDGHGTAVAFTAAGRRNGAGAHGVAFEATVIALRADRPGTCASESTDDEDGGCRFPTDAIAQGVDAARAARARVINMSLGGSTMPPELQAAIGRATAAGIVVVIAAGNDGTDNPDQFTDVANTANANSAIIIAGSIGATGTLSSFSDKAGTSAAAYLTAVGQGVRAPDETGTPRPWSGTSFAAPQISGAVALLAQAFPNLSGAAIVDLLLTTARDAGAAGTDPVYGRGILDLTRAFQPVGRTNVAGSAAARVSAAANGQTSPAMGDAAPSGVGAVILDGYDRAFAIDLARTLARAAPARPLGAALRSRATGAAFAVGGTSVAMTLAPTRNGATLDRTSLTRADADAARAIAGSVVQRLGGRTSFALGFNQGAGSLTAQLAGSGEPAFLVAGASSGIDTAPGTSVAVRHLLRGWGVSAGAESGAVLSPREHLLPGTRYWQRTPYDRVALGVDRALGPLVARAGVTRLHEDATVLGARFGPALGNPGATSWFSDAGATVAAGGWSLGGAYRRGWTAARVHGFAGGGGLRTSAWSVDLGRAGLMGRDRLDLRVAQPLRVASGGIDLTLPTGWDYASGSVSAFTSQRLALAPRGRELDVEALYTLPVARGALRTNLYWRRDPGNVTALGPDYGAAVRWAMGF